jgi:hypothetical protein
MARLLEIYSDGTRVVPVHSQRSRGVANVYIFNPGVALHFMTLLSFEVYC